MANFSITVTNAGLALLTGAVAGDTLTFTGIALGSGAYSGSLAAATALVAPKLTLPVSALIKGTGQVTVKGVLTYNTVTTGFEWTEVGLYAADPDGGADILYAYGYAGDKGDYIPSKDEATLTEKVIRLTVMVSNTANVTAQIDGNTIYVSPEDLEDLEQSVNQSITNITQVIQQVTGADITGGGEITIDGSMVVTLTHAKDGTVHTFTGLGDRTGLVPCQFKSTAGYTEGDTATIDGTAYTITLTGADDPETDLFVSGKSILVDVDTESKTINFKAGGGLTKAKLALADATEDTVFNGRTFYAGEDKTLRTGTALAETTDVAPGNLFNGKKAYDNDGNLVTGTALNQITTVTALKMFTGVTAYDQFGKFITGTPKPTNITADYLPAGKTAYNAIGTLLTGTGAKTVNYLTGTLTMSCNYSGSVTSGKTIIWTGILPQTPKMIAVWFPVNGTGASTTKFNVSVLANGILANYVEEEWTADTPMRASISGNTLKITWNPLGNWEIGNPSSRKATYYMVY